MRSFHRLIIGITSICCIAFIGAFFIYQNYQKKHDLPEHIQKNQQIGTEDSEITVYDLNTKPILLSSFKNKVVLINFWATWCAPCIEELPSLNKLAGHFPEELIILAISNERTDDIKNFLMAFPDFHSNFIPSNMGRNQMLAYFNIRAFPETYILSTDGKLHKKIIGPQKWDSENWKTEITLLIKEKPLKSN